MNYDTGVSAAVIAVALTLLTICPIEKIGDGLKFTIAMMAMPKNGCS